jgi:hypothetical protein
MRMNDQNLRLSPALSGLQSSVQLNCDISDARFASDYTLCVYLLKMREYYRWEMGFPYDHTLPHDEVGDWLTSREQRWEQLEDHEFQPLVVEGEDYDPFDSEPINEALEAHQLLYSAGYGNKAKPHFFLGRLERRIDHEGFRVYISGQEFARDLAAPPAMSLNGQIYIRRESLRRMLWEKLEEWRWNKPDNAMGRAIRFYDFDNDLDTALDEMTDTEIEALVLHEIGEVMAGQALGDSWHEMLGSFPRSRLEFMARAVRDHLADALSTLPTLLERAHPPSLHFYFANLSGMRKEIYPALISAYKHWVESGDVSELSDLAQTGRTHWLRVAQELVELHESRVKTAWQEMESLIERKSL